MAHFHFDSDRHEVAPNLGPHAAHGLGFDQPWAVTSAGPNNLTSELQLGPPWPFGGRVVQHVELTPGRLVLTLDILADARPMPAMAGWHPWFNRRLDRGRAVELEVDPVAMYERDDRHLPTGRLVPPGPRPWDDCVTGMRADPILRWPEALELRLTSTCDSWVIYDEPDHAVCVEPQTGPPDEFNRSPVIAAPGRPLRAGFTLAWREL